MATAHRATRAAAHLPSATAGCPQRPRPPLHPAATAPGPHRPLRPRSACNADGDSASSSVSRSPAVSTISTGIPPSEMRSITRSRVVPGVAVTIARSRCHQPVEQRGLARIRPSNNGHCQAVVNQPSLGGSLAATGASAASSAPAASQSPHPALRQCRLRQSRYPLRRSPARPVAPLSEPPACSAHRLAARAATRAWYSVSAAIRSRTASAWVRSMRPCRKARCVNSPGRASRAPASRAAAPAGSRITGDPCAAISSTSSPV